jgi:hypothetical protein
MGAGIPENAQAALAKISIRSKTSEIITICNNKKRPLAPNLFCDIIMLYAQEDEAEISGSDI